MRANWACLMLLLAIGSTGRAAVVIGHPPDQSGALASDTGFPFVGMTSAVLADDFTVNTAVELRHITWWGHYWGEAPPASETMRIRIYGADGGTGRPGDLLHESVIIDPPHTATGLLIPSSPGTSAAYTEYVMQSDLAAPVALDANTPYWFELAQVGDHDSAFYWEFSDADHTGIAYLSGGAASWRPGLTQKDLAFQLNTIPEPSAIILISAFAVCIATSRRFSR